MLALKPTVLRAALGRPGSQANERRSPAGRRLACRDRATAVRELGQHGADAGRQRRCHAARRGSRALLDGRGWFDLHEPRIAPPAGFDTHWSRLIDGGLWLLFAMTRPFADAAFAERLVRVVWPMLWLLPAMIGVTAMSWRLAGRQAAYAALLLLVVGLPAFQQFRPGRIDHHNVQIALALLVLAATVWADRKPWAAWAAGLLSGLAVAIGLEGAPFVAVAGTVFVARWIVEPHDSACAHGLCDGAGCQHDNPVRRPAPRLPSG